MHVAIAYGFQEMARAETRRRGVFSWQNSSRTHVCARLATKDSQVRFRAIVRHVQGGATFLSPQRCVSGDRNTQPNKTHLTITYPYHPLCGQTVTVVYKMPRGNVDGWHVRSHDGRVWRIAHWMTLSRWKTLQVSATPLIAPTHLLGLHRRLQQIRVPSSDGIETISEIT